MWNEFLTAFEPFFEYFFSMVDKVIGIFMNTAVIDGVPQGITLFGVPLLMYPICFMFLTLIVQTIFSGLTK